MDDYLKREFETRKFGSFDDTWFETHPHTLPSRRFLESLLKLGPTDALFFEAKDKVSLRRLAIKLRVRLWRYAEAGYIKYREFSCLAVKNCIAVSRNLDPIENNKKRNLKRKGAGEVDRACLENKKGLTALVGSNPTLSE